MPNVAETREFFDWLLKERDLSHGLKMTRDATALHAVSGVNWASFGLEKENYIECESPWHAAMLSLYSMGAWADDRLDPSMRLEFAKQQLSQGATIPKMPPISTLFRGQRNPTWLINSSRQRLSIREQNDAKHATARFCSVLQEAFLHFGLPHVDNDSLEAAAQHYGLETDMIDFTLDPLVAVYFANLKPEESSEGSVYVITSAKLIKRFGLQIILPPPLIERLYIQRGLFLQLSETEVQDFRTECLEIRFKKHPDYVVKRAGLPVLDILKPDPFLAALCEDCHSWSAASNRWNFSEHEQAGRAKTILASMSDLITDDFKSALHRDLYGLWMYHSSDLIEGICMGNLDGTLKVVEDFLDIVAKSNPVLCTLIISYYYGQFYALHQASRKDFHKEFSEAYQLARLLSASLHGRSTRN